MSLTYCDIIFLLQWKISKCDVIFLLSWIHQFQMYFWFKNTTYYAFLWFSLFVVCGVLCPFNMPQYSLPERVWLVEHYYKSFGHGRNGGPSVKMVMSDFREHFGKDPPTKANIFQMLRKYHQDGTLRNLNSPRSGRPRTVRTNENHGIVFEKIVRSPKKSIRRTSRELHLSFSSTRRIISDLGAHSYRIQILQSLTANDIVLRRQYCERMLAIAYQDEEYFSNIWWSDECHILLSGHVNRQNMRFIGWMKPEEYAQKPLHSAKVTVWCALSSHGIIGPYFLEDQNGNCVTVTAAVYRDQVIDRFTADLRLLCDEHGIDYAAQIFQQDGAPAHTGRGNLQYLAEVLPGGANGLISRFADMPFPPRSPDLTPLDSFLWGFVKERCFRDPVPTTIDELKANVERVTDSVTENTLRAVVANNRRRLELCLERQGEHLEHIIL